MPSGAVGLCGRMPRTAATSLVGISWMERPFRSTAPAVGARSRAIDRSRVDLPQALGPTMTVIRPGGTVTLRSRTISRSP